MKDDKILFSQSIPAFINNKSLGNYTCSIVERDGQIFLVILEPFIDGPQQVGCWYFSDVMETTFDSLWIDYGQGWGVTGMDSFRRNYEDYKKLISAKMS